MRKNTSQWQASWFVILTKYYGAQIKENETSSMYEGQRNFTHGFDGETSKNWATWKIYAYMGE
jgi:hypothetical protein